MNQTRRSALQTIVLGTASLALPQLSGASEKNKPNVLFIAVDDLRPQLNCYGQTQIISPNIDRLAGQGTQFERCFCQVPVCGASRASLLSGVRPTKDRFVTYKTKLDDDLPGALSLPKHFKDNGYHTLSIGKVFHHQNDSLNGWSEKPWRPKSLPGENWRNYLLDESKQLAKENTQGRGPAWECADVPDDAYFDGQSAKQAVNKLRQMKQEDKSFFLAVGFLKPHLPFNAPKKYWDLYDRDKINLADNPFRPKDAPDAAIHNWGELRQYAQIPPKGPLSDEMARSMIHGYYACTSYTDALIGQLMDELDRLGLSENTIVVLWGDHGWNLGEHTLWCKHCNFETSTRAPLIVRAPGMPKGRRCNALTEFVDIYPSLCELAGLPLPKHLEGLSLVPLMKSTNRSWKKAIYSRFHNGDSVKTDRYQYTEWKGKDGSVYARMLYDHKNDPDENINIAERPENEKIIWRMKSFLKKGWKSALPD